MAQRTFHVPFISDDRLRQAAESFLSKLNSDRAIPVPIEGIVEFRMELDIVPVPGLHRIADVDGFINSSLTAIYVDQFVFEERPNRYCFTLAHEVAHAFMHRDIYRLATFDSVKGWLEWCASVTTADLDRLEFQAHAFAGLVLVPPAELSDAWNDAVKTAKRHKLSFESREGIRTVAAWIAKRFGVSTDVVEIRIERDRLFSSA